MAITLEITVNSPMRVAARAAYELGSRGFSPTEAEQALYEGSVRGMPNMETCLLGVLASVLGDAVVVKACTKQEGCLTFTRSAKQSKAKPTREYKQKPWPQALLDIAPEEEWVSVKMAAEALGHAESYITKPAAARYQLETHRVKDASGRTRIGVKKDSLARAVRMQERQA